MNLLIRLVVLALASVSTGSQVSPPTLEMLQARAQERMQQDLTIYSRDDLRALEELYQSANRDLRAP
jgi:hypothetical protein